MYGYWWTSGGNIYKRKEVFKERLSRKLMYLLIFNVSTFDYDFNRYSTYGEVKISINRDGIEFAGEILRKLKREAK